MGDGPRELDNFGSVNLGRSEFACAPAFCQAPPPPRGVAAFSGSLAEGVSGGWVADGVAAGAGVGGARPCEEGSYLRLIDLCITQC